MTVRHEVSNAGGLAVADEHDIVYRSATGPAVAPPVPAPSGEAWSREIRPDPVLLFRYSAVTFNGHRIHYDQPYATRVEGYPGLVVHGPLVATLLVDLLRRKPAGRRPRALLFPRAAAAFRHGAVQRVRPARRRRAIREALDARCRGRDHHGGRRDVAVEENP